MPVSNNLIPEAQGSCTVWKLRTIIRDKSERKSKGLLHYYYGQIPTIFQLLFFRILLSFKN